MTTCDPAPSLAVHESSAIDQRYTSTVVVFASVVCVCIVATCAIASQTPLGFSIAIVFLFAGPHNWLEARYFLARMPARWGKLTPYFATGLGGVVLLTVGQIALTGTFRWLEVSSTTWILGTAIWNSLFLAWATCLVWLRSRQNPRRPAWEWALPAACLLLALNWRWPLAWSLGLIYLHPLVALLFLDRELGRYRIAWQRTYRRCLCLVPLALGALWWRTAGQPDLPGTDLLTMQITHHAGAGVLRGVSTHLLVATHTFLEMLHYTVWILAIPLIGIRSVPWNVSGVPLTKVSSTWKRTVVAMLCLGGLVVAVLWAGFLVDYPMTRDIYFTIALGHVLAEIPFLLRLL